MHEKKGIGQVREQGTHGYAKDLREMCDAQIDHAGSLGLDAGDDVAVITALVDDGSGSFPEPRRDLAVGFDGGKTVRLNLARRGRGGSVFRITQRPIDRFRLFVDRSSIDSSSSFSGYISRSSAFADLFQKAEFDEGIQVQKRGVV